MTPIAFIHDLHFEDLPPEIVARAKLCLLDLIGVAASGTRTELSRIVRNHAARQMCASAGGARLMFDGRRVSMAGAAFANASTIDSFDAHDGHALTKGHAGVALLPALLAFAEDGGLQDGREFLTCLVMGYEIATRAGIALHASVSDYHTSGAWNALGCAAIGARLLGLDPETTRHALGIAEYNGPRSQMMRCIDHPTMLKDGSGWGAFTGVTAACLAQDGFSGAPAITIEAADEADVWGDLGRRWMTMEQYVKPYPVCRWAQPAIEAAAALTARHAVDPKDIAAVKVLTFAAGVALGTKAPTTTEEAQYALGFPLACMLARGAVGAYEISAPGLAEPETLAMLARIELVEHPDFTASFPAERLAIVEFTLRDGRILSSPPTTPRGNPENFLSDAEIDAKFNRLADVGPATRDRIRSGVQVIDTQGARGLAMLLDAIAGPIGGEASAATVGSAAGYEAAAAGL